MTSSYLKKPIRPEADAVAGFLESAAATVRELGRENRDLSADAARYRFLRSRDLETVYEGGIFVGRTPENLVINEDTLDAAVDEAMAVEGGQGHG